MAIGFVSGSVDGTGVNMQDEKWIFFKTKFDSLSCITLVVMLIGVMIWADIHSSDKFLSWLEQTTTTVLGTYLGLAQPWKSKNGGNGNGSTTSSTTTTNGSSTSTSSSAT